LYQEFYNFFCSIGFFGWQIATIYALFVCVNINLFFAATFMGFFLSGGWLNHQVFKRYISDLRPKNYIPFLASENVNFYRQSNGMPSGHTQQTAFALTIAYLFTNKNLLPSLILFAITFWQRFHFKNHTFLQLLAGGLIGTTLGVISYHLMRQLFYKRNSHLFPI